MPYVLRHMDTGEIAACIQKNNYNLNYYGIKQWETEDEALNERDAFLDALGREDAHQWLLLHLDENRVKIGNVKLKNDPSRVLLMSREGVFSVASLG